MSAHIQILKELVSGHFAENGQSFSRCAMYDERLDTLTVLEENCSFYEDFDGTGPIVVLRANHGTAEARIGRIVGVRICGWKHLSKNFAA